MLIVGLTGGIASGKTTVARLFAELGVPVLDADLIGRELVKPGLPCLCAIVERFGDTMLTPAGELDRPKLRHLILADTTARHHLEAILHPAIWTEMQQRAQRLTAPYSLFVIPLLLESGQYKEVDRVLVVDLPEVMQRQRIAARDHLSEQEIDAVLAIQATRAARLAIADDTLDNSRGLEQLTPQVAPLHHRYNQLAHQRLPPNDS
ncbi:MAG: dephospho-CoA kinase [Halothiobacillaceae bacterium]|nr:MAG: dephospho-CoA kinase [Halothiobacillaceae bacterium]